MVRDDCNQILLSGSDFDRGGSGEFGPEVGEVGFAVGEGVGDSGFEEIQCGKLRLGLVGLVDEARTHQLDEVGLAAGETEDFFDDTICVAHFEVGVGVAQEIFRFVGFEVAHFDRDDANEITAPVGSEFVEGLDAGEHEGELVVVLDEAAELVEKTEAEVSIGDRTPDFFKFVEVEEKSAVGVDFG